LPCPLEGCGIFLTPNESQPCNYGRYILKVSVFRVEDAVGAGPYSSTSPFLAAMNATHGGADHPSPDEDPLLQGIYPDENCCFATLDGLEEWFAGYEDDLAEAGYEISVYTVPRENVRWGISQALFRREDRYPVRTMSMR